MKFRTGKWLLALASVVPFSACMKMEKDLAGPTQLQSAEPGGASVNINTGKVGALAKAAEISLISLRMTLSAPAEDTISRIVDLSGNAAHTVTQAFTGLASMKTWRLSASTYDTSGRIIHSGATTFQVLPGRVSEVSMSLPALYSMLKANFFPVRDSVTRVELWVDGAKRKDSAFAKQAHLGDTVALAFDYLGTEATHDIRMNVYGDMWGSDTLLYSSDTALNVVAGADGSQGILLRWVGPRTPPPGEAAMSVSLGAAGTTNMLGELDARGAFSETFSSPILDSAWNVYQFPGIRAAGSTGPANHYSLTEQAGSLVYYLDPMTHGDGFIDGYQTTVGLHSCCTHDPGEEVSRSLEGDHWTLETKVDYYMPYSNGRTLDLRIYFGDGNLGTQYVGFFRGRDTGYNEVDAVTVRKDGPDPVDYTYLDRQAVKSFPNAGSEGDNLSIYYRIIREGSWLRLLWSDDGKTWSEVITRNLGSGLSVSNQRVTLTGLSWFSSAGSYAAYDYIRLAPNP